MALPCNAILYRLVLRSGWFDPDDPLRVQPDAFFKRPTDVDGLSVFRADQIGIDECLCQLKCFGAVSLHVGTLRDLGLEVIEDNADGRKALITNLPFENPGNAQEEKLAGDVARTSRIVRHLKKRSDKPQD